MEILKQIDIKLLAASPTQPRKHFNEKEIQDLTESIKTHDVIQPILVRGWRKEVKKEKYEIIDGERRYRASIAAGKLTIKCLLVEMSDDEVVETQMIGHLHRADLHPLEEAEAYEKLIGQGKYDARELAAKVGKSASHIYQRIALTKLIEPAKDLMWKGKLNAHHGLLIARCLPAFQEKILQRFDYAIEAGSVSSSEIFGFIESNQFCVLKKAPFRTDDADLIPAVGPCTTCVKRSGNNVDLFNDVAGKDTCTDKPCYDEKVKAQIVRVKDEIRAKGTEPIQICTEYYTSKKPKGTLLRDEYELCSKTDKDAVPAVVVIGDEIGKKKYVKLKEKEPEEKKALKLSKEEQEAESKHASDKVTAAISLLYNATKDAPLSDSLIERLLDHCNAEYETIQAAEQIGVDPKKITTTQSALLYIFWNDVTSRSYGSNVGIDANASKVYKEELNIDLPAHWKQMDKDFAKAKKAAKPEPEKAVEADAEPTKGKARKSKLKKESMKM